MWSSKVNGSSHAESAVVNHSVHKALLEQAVRTRKPVATPAAPAAPAPTRS